MEVFIYLYLVLYSFHGLEIMEFKISLCLEFKISFCSKVETTCVALPSRYFVCFFVLFLFHFSYAWNITI